MKERLLAAQQLPHSRRRTGGDTRVIDPEALHFPPRRTREEIPTSVVPVYSRTKRFLVVGFTEMGRALARRLQSDNSRTEVVGYLDAGEHPEIVGDICDLVKIARRNFVDTVVVATSMTGAVARAIEEARLDHIEVAVVPDRRAAGDNARKNLAPSADGKFATTIAGFPAVVLHQEARSRMHVALKRAIDILGATVGIVLLLPLFFLLSLLVKLDSLRGPIFYSHTRVGKKGRPFTCYKFRTMVPQADALKSSLRHLNELGDGFFFKMRADPRLTRVGRYLRRYSLDELPQLVNVLRGDMSLVGPRPSPVDEFRMYDTDHLRRLDVKPGITGLWQIVGRRDPAFARAMEVDREYVNHWSVWLDLTILAKTIRVLADGE
jgi:exopolysaccharide biosynthesis polyprenyl glycosylphosphotransferase